eukprot:COSAG06_NODE_48053_length_335_cov_0.436441_1_plen_23_part_01
MQRVLFFCGPHKTYLVGVEVERV